MLSSGFFVTKNVAKAEETEVVLFDGTYNFSSASKTSESFTPFDFTNSARMTGSSWKLATAEKIYTDGADVEHAYNYADDFLTFDAAQNISGDGKSLFIWMYFGKSTAPKHEISLLVDETNYIKWTLNQTVIQGLLQKTGGSTPTISSYDAEVYHDTSISDYSDVPFGWNLIELPFSLASATGTASNTEATTFASIKIVQSAVCAYEDNMLVYSAYVDFTTSGVNTYTNAEEQDNVIFNIGKISAPSDGTSYYAGEDFNLPSFNDIFGPTNYLWVGKTDYSTFSDILQYENYFMIKMVNGTDTQDFDLGEGTKLSAGIYNVYTCITPQENGGEAVLLENFYFECKSYGQGIWFIETALSGKIGETYTINYKIDNAFKEASFNNEVVVGFGTEGVLELVEHNKSASYIKVKVLKEGSTSIVLTLTSDRLSQRSNLEELVNSSFVVTCTPEVEENKTTKILLWVTLGIIVSGGIAFGIYSLVKSKKIEVK